MVLPRIEMPESPNDKSAGGEMPDVPGCGDGRGCTDATRLTDQYDQRPMLNNFSIRAGAAPACPAGCSSIRSVSSASMLAAAA